MHWKTLGKLIQICCVEFDADDDDGDDVVDDNTPAEFS